VNDISSNTILYNKRLLLTPFIEKLAPVFADISLIEGDSKLIDNAIKFTRKWLHQYHNRKNA
jgi:hypothetical protein